MANLLHLPDLAASRPPAAGVARRRRAARVVAASASPGGRVKQQQQQEAGAGKGRVIRVADPVREGRLLVPLPLFSVPVTPASESPAATKRRDDDEEERRRYYLNLGYAIRTLREEIPDVFNKEPSFDIYREDIVFRDPFNKFQGIDNYRSLFWGLRFTGRIFFKALWVDIVSIWQPADDLIMIRWIAHGVPRVPWDGHARFDGASVYKLDRNGKIYEHKVHNIATKPTDEIQGLVGSRANQSCYMSIHSKTNLFRGFISIFECGPVFLDIVMDQTQCSVVPYAFPSKSRRRVAWVQHDCLQILPFCCIVVYRVTN